MICRLLQVVESVSQVGHESCAERNVNTGGCSQADRHLPSALSETGTEAVGSGDRVSRQPALPAQLLQVVDCQFKHISLLQLGNILSLSTQSTSHEIFQLIQAPVNASTSLSLQQRFRNLIRKNETRNR